MFKFLIMIMFFLMNLNGFNTEKVSLSTIQNTILADSLQNNVVPSDSIGKPDSVWVVYMDKTKASFYGGETHGKNYDGCKTANGERYNMWSYTFAIKRKLRRVTINGVMIDFNTIIRVTNLSNGNQVILRCNDTGGLTPSRSIDISRQAMMDLGGQHIMNVKIEVLQK